MKIFKILFTIAVITIAFFSCQKELKFPDTGVAYGTFKKDAAGDCLPVTVNGVFKVDSVLTNALFVDVQINANTPGNFDIRSDTINGFSFYKVGTVPFGVNTVRLYAYGKPKAAGTNTFTVTFGASTCSFDITTVGAGSPAAVFTLSGSPTACTGVTVGGTYTAGVALAPANTLTVEVNVTTVGTYTILAAATPGNNFGFTGSGVFTTSGLQNVTLTGTGTPATAGISNFSIVNGGNSCTYPITVLPASGGAAVYTMDGASGTCTNFIVNGTYTAGVPTTTTNTVKLQVNVTTIGTYSITTNVSNGLSFSASGSFTTTGAQTVTLLATGTPGVAGQFSYSPVTGSGGSTCNFIVIPVAPPNLDYFPLTNNSWWSYDEAQAANPATDTLYNVIFGTHSYNGSTFTEMQDNYAALPFDTAHYRKTGNNYNEWMPTDYYSYLVYFDGVTTPTPAYTEANFLRENATAGTTWNVPTTGSFSGTIDPTGTGTTSVPGSLKYTFTVVDPNTTLTINSITYTNVIHLTVDVKWTVPSLSITDGVTETDDYYYAKGIGLIKTVVTSGPAISGSSTDSFTIKHYKVN